MLNDHRQHVNGKGMLEQVECDIAAVRQSQPGSVPLPVNEDWSVDRLPHRAPQKLRDIKSTFDIDNLLRFSHDGEMAR